MEKEEQIDNAVLVFTTIVKRLIDPDYIFPSGGKHRRIIGRVIDRIDAQFGCVSPERLVDACVIAAYSIRHFKHWTIKFAFPATTGEKTVIYKQGATYYQNLWLKTGNLSRQFLIQLISDKDNPLTHYIYVASEESTKSRHLNTEAGYLVCQLSTLGWSPISKCCTECQYSLKCKAETEKKYPELYKLRIDNEPRTKRTNR